MGRFGRIEVQNAAKWPCGESASTSRYGANTASGHDESDIPHTGSNCFASPARNSSRRRAIRPQHSFLRLRICFVALLFFASLISAANASNDNNANAAAALADDDDSETLERTRAAAADGVLRLQSAPVGRIFALADEPIILDTLPNWMHASKTPAGSFFGIPQLNNLGQYVLVDEKGNLHAIQVVEETKTECGDGVKTSWMEILHPSKNIDQLSVLEQIQWINRTYEMLRTPLKELENTRDDFRVFPFGYLARYRLVDDTITDNILGDEIDAKRAVLALNVSCGELTQYSLDVISTIAENAAEFRVVAGDLSTQRAAVRTTTSAPYKTTRTTRQVHDNRPVAFNQLTTFQCKRGILCRLDVGENTFVDAEDGSTSRLRLAVHAMDANTPAAANFLVAISRTAKMEGVPLTAGAYHLRIEARDRLNQTASLPFKVVVDETPEHNHVFVMTLDSTLEKFNKRRAETIRDFVYQLSEALSGSARDEKNARTIFVAGLEETGPSQVTIRWANATLSRRVCNENAINKTREQMLAAKDFDRVRHDFRRQMGPMFYVKKVTLELSGVCNLLKNFKAWATTTQTTVDAEPAPAGALIDALVLPLILLAVLLLFLTLLIIFYCMHVKNRQQRKKKKQQQKHSDYITKGGLPVVFPQEVPLDEDEDAAINAGVTSPMLMAREQPPLDPTRMTLHENPLYKPPGVSATGATAPLSNSTSTFASPSDLQQQAQSVQNLLRQSPFAAMSPRVGAIAATAAVGQRSPPPYTAAI